VIRALRIHEKWTKVVEELGLDLTRPVNRVTARQIKRITGEEPRIMAKMDTRSDLPQMFRANGLFVLPVSNGEYVIVRGNGYHDLESQIAPSRKFHSAMPFELSTSKVGQSEMQFVDLAYNAGLIEHFAGVDSLYLSVRGRKYSPAFDLRVGESPVIHVEGVQVEIDGGFEGERTFVVLEAKLNWPGDFNIRQLYYPFRFWDETLRSRKIAKDVRPIFLVYDTRTSTYTLREYRFGIPADYESIELVHSENFVLEWRPIEMDRFRIVSPDTRGRRRTIVPQADDVSKIGELPFLAWLGIDNSETVARHFGFNIRQSSYYSQAAEALGLIELTRGRYALTDLGLKYIRKSTPERNEFLCTLMLQLPLFNEALATMLLDPGKTISKQQIMEIIRRRGYSGATLGRRARTILSWFDWMGRTFGSVEVSRDRVSLFRHQRRLTSG